MGSPIQVPRVLIKSGLSKPRRFQLKLGLLLVVPINRHSVSSEVRVSHGSGMYSKGPNTRLDGIFTIEAAGILVDTIIETHHPGATPPNGADYHLSCELVSAIWTNSFVTANVGKLIE